MVHSIRVLLADKEKLIHDSIKLIIEQDDQLILVGELVHKDDLQSMCPKLRPDILLFAPNIAEEPLTFLESLKQYCPELKILVLFSNPNEIAVKLLNVEKIDGAILKFDPPEILLNAISTITQGNPWFSPSLLKKMLQHQRQIINTQLTTQEIALLRLIVAEKKDPEIAQELNVSTRTVRNYLQNVYCKLDVNSRAAAVYQATKRDLI